MTINSPTEVKTCGGINICNEIDKGQQSLSIGDDGQLSITNGNSIQLPSPALSLSSEGKLSISSGNTVQLPDNSASNEIQTLTINSGRISLSNGGGSVDVPDPSSTNEIQTLSINDRELSISNGNSVTLPDTQVWSYTKKITYQVPITVTSTTWAGVPIYELILNFPRNFSLVQITLQIPYCGALAASKFVLVIF